ncbi:MAG: TRAP transporter large permease subunit, partial [Arenibacterium sp.]
LGIAQVDEARIPKLSNVMRKGWFVIVPFVVLLGGLFIMNMRPETAALYAVLSLFLLSLLRTYGGGRIKFRALVEVLIRSGKVAVEVVLICAIAGMIIGLFARSGLSFGMGFFLVQLGKSSLILLLLVTAAVCILMGMGLPTVGVYLLLSTLAAPPLIELGLQAMPAHLFVLYFGMLSMLTPPVAIAAFVAANMAKAPPMRTGFEAVRIAWPAFVMPFLFVLSPSLILQGEWSDIIPTVLTTLIGVYLVTAGLIGFVFTSANPVVRVVLMIAGIALIWPETTPNSFALSAGGLILGAIALLYQRMQARNAEPAGSETAR